MPVSGNTAPFAHPTGPCAPCRWSQALLCTTTSCTTCTLGTPAAIAYRKIKVRGGEAAARCCAPAEEVSHGSPAGSSDILFENNVCHATTGASQTQHYGLNNTYGSRRGRGGGHGGQSRRLSLAPSRVVVHPPQPLCAWVWRWLAGTATTFSQAHTMSLGPRQTHQAFAA
jgi:hypothetical protein